MLESAFLVLASLVQPPAEPVEHPPEFRGVWVTRFDWAHRDPESCRQRIVDILDDVAGAGCNAVVWQVRGAAEALYPSELEPWSRLVGGRDPGFDPLQLALDEAHARGLAFHAYVNPMPLRSAGLEEPPPPDHLWHRHGPDAGESWVCRDESGQPIESQYLYLSAGIPAVHARVRAVVRDLVTRYEVDGVHLDRIRYPGPMASHDPISRARFTGRGNPRRMDYADWQRSQLDQLVNDMAAEVRQIRPSAVMSAAVWGIYDRYRLPGYATFSSGYHDYFQDSWRWVRLGAMDWLMPMIYWDEADPKPNHAELFGDFVAGLGAAHMVSGQRAFGGDENARQLDAVRKLGAAGTVVFSHGSAKRAGVYDRYRDDVFREPAPVPVIERLARPDSGTLLGTVLDDAGEPLVDAWVTLATQEPTSRWPTWTSSADGRFAFLGVPPGSVEVRVAYPGAGTVTVGAEIEVGAVGVVEVTIPGSGAVRGLPFLDIVRAPKQTAAEVAHVLGRTSPGCRVVVGERNVEVWSTGLFAIDGLSLEPGENVFEIVAVDAEDGRSVHELRIERVEPTAPDEGGSVLVTEPGARRALRPGELLTVRATGPAGLSGEFFAWGDSAAGAMAETAAGVYVGAVRVPDGAAGWRGGVRVVLRDVDGGAVDATSEGSVEVWHAAEVVVAEVSAESAGITHGLHDVRLGGPWLGHAPRGTRFEVVGREGRALRVRLTPSRSGWVRARDVELLPQGTPPPRAFFTNCSIGGDDTVDRITIPLRSPIPFAVRAETEPVNRIILDLFGAHHAATWISHRTDAQVLGDLSVEQVADEHVRLSVPVRSRQIWGYWTERQSGSLSVFVRRPPARPDVESAWSGLRIALEPGHGGSNTGAVGAFGTEEKTVNARAVDALEAELTKRGAEVVVVRVGDETISLGDRVDRAIAAEAHFLVSVHANAAGTSGGYLRVSGTSTYYHQPHLRAAAESVYRELLGLGWNEFGCVGNFSYTPIRETRVPGILVEQAFLSHPGDEARLLDPAYLRAQAVAIADGLESFFSAVR